QRVAPGEVEVRQPSDARREVLDHRAGAFEAPRSSARDGARAIAWSMSRKRAESGTSCTRRIAAPPAAAAARAASDPDSRSETAESSATPEKRRTKALRDAPTQIGNPSERNAGRCRRSVRLPSSVLPKPRPGSIAIASGDTPAATARSA